MGRQNSLDAYARWGNLPHRPFRMLAYMALASLDHPSESTPARLFFEGHEALARAIGYEALTPTSRDAVKRDVRLLKREGAITVLAGGVNGRNARYILNLGVSQRPPGGGPETPCDGGPETPR